jgi:hypothetical protein
MLRMNSWCASLRCAYISVQETDFSMVAECGLSTAVAASGLPDLKMARHRVLQCVRYRPSFRAIAAWVLCNKGRRTSNAFVRALNEALLKADTRSGDDHREQRQQAWTLLMQVIGCTLPPVPST